MVKRWRVPAVALGVVGVGLAWAWFGARLRAENWPLVQTGQTQTEVEALLGGPPGNYGSLAVGSVEMTLEGIMAPRGSTERVWCDDRTRLEVWFDPAGRVAAYHKRSGYRQHPVVSW